MAFLDEPQVAGGGSPRWPRLALLLLAALWLGAELLAALGVLPASAAVSLDRGRGILLPAALLIGGWALTRHDGKAPAKVDGSAALEATRALTDAIGGADQLLDSTARTAFQVQADMAEQARMMDRAARSLDRAARAAVAAATAVDGSLSALAERLPPIAQSSEQSTAAIEAALANIDGRLERCATMLDALETRSETVAVDGERASQRMTEALGTIEEQAGRTTQLIANRAYALDGAVTGVLDRSVEVLDGIRESMLAQGAAIENSVRSARETLESCGREIIAELDRQLARLTSRAQGLDALLAARDGATAHAAVEAEERLSAIEERLAQLTKAAASERALLSDAVASVQNAAEATLARTSDARAAVAALEERVVQLPPMLHALDSELGGQLPDLEGAVGRLDAAIADIAARMSALENAIARSSGLLADLSAARAAEEAHLDALVARFTAARIG